jgi:long-chain acyl-CoA synthetase
MFAMTFTDWSGVPTDVAAARAEIEAEIAGSTLLTEFAETVAQAPDVVAHSWQADGEWRSLTYRQLHGQVRDAALGLAAVGLRPGEFAAVWSRNRSEATIADYAVMHARGVPVFIYPTVAPEQAADIIGHCAATVVIVELEFLPVLDSIQDRLPQLRAVVVLGDETARDVTHDGAEAQPGETQALGWQALLDLGHAEAELDPGAFERGWRQVMPDTLATLIYTSGTTGSPKAVMITHRNVRYGQQATLRVIPLADQVGPDGSATLVSYLPMAHVTGRTVDHWGPLAHPVTLAYCPDQLKLFEVAAHARPR